jgi:hypothetical protein
MKSRTSLIKLLLGSLISGIIIKYAAPAGADPVPLIGQFFRDLIFSHTLTHIPYEFFKVDILLWFILLLLIALVPFMFALFSGVWGFLTYLCGFLGGYLIIGGLFITPEFFYLVAGILCLGLGILSALYGEFIKA